MALTTTQVQQVFLAITGRPAEGQAAAWGANSLSISALANSVIDIRKGADFANNKDTFIENLYQNLLGRASDAEGKEFWLKVLNDGASYGDVVAQFINAVLVQSQTADLYILQNKLGIAEQISAQINTFQGGAAAEATLVQIMSNVAADTKIEDLSNDIENFKGQNVNVASVSVNTAADNEKYAKGSEENSTVFNATVNILGGEISADENTLLVEGSSNYSDTLNLTLRASKDSEGKETVNLDSVLGEVTGVDILNLDVKDNNIEAVRGNVSGYDSVTFTGTSKDELTVTTNMTLLSTGNGDDKVSFTAATSIKLLDLDAGDDIVNLTGVAAGQSKTSLINGGNGTNTLQLTKNAANNDASKVAFKNIDVIKAMEDFSADKITLNAASLDGANLSLDSDSTNKLGIVVNAPKGINLSKIDYVEGGTNATIDINGVKSGKVQLTSSEIAVTETINLTAATSKVEVTNFGAADRVKLLAGTDTASIVAGTKLFDAGSSKLLTGAGIDGLTKIVGTNGKVAAELVQAFSAANTAFTASGQKGYIAQVKDGKTSLYEITNDGTTAAVIDANDHVKLLATFDAALAAANFIA
ncbi:MAG: DUF4214 domain-containing protein [Campylobacter sp.]|nr:DUF4214 domain-containing protein [Campylobacter sp.]